MAVQFIDALPGMAVGQGFDSIRNDVKVSTAVVGKTGTSPRASGQQGDYSFTLVNSRDEFHEALGIDVSLSVGFGLFGASAKASFADEARFTEQTTFCVVSFNARNALETFTSQPKLAPEAEELLRLRKDDRFLARFGTCWVSGCATGGEFLGTIRIQADSTAREEEIAAEINARYGPVKGSFKAEHTSSATSSNEEITILTYQAGGGVRPVFTLDELFDQVKRVAQEVDRQRGVPIGYTLESYRELELPMDDISAIEAERAQSVMRRLKRLYSDLKEKQNDLDFVLTHPHLYEALNAKALNNANQDVARTLNEVVEHADRCSRDLSRCEDYTGPIPQVEIPERKKKRGAIRTRRLGRAENKERQARLIRELVQHLPEGKRRKRLGAEAAELDREARTLRAAAKSPAHPPPARPTRTGETPSMKKARPGSRQAAGKRTTRAARVGKA